MEESSSLADKSKNRMELRLKKYKSEIKINRLLFLVLALINIVSVMVLSFTGQAAGSNYSMNLTYVRICIAFTVLTVILSIAPIIRSILE